MKSRGGYHDVDEFYPEEPTEVCRIPIKKADALIEALKEEICRNCEEEDGRCGEKDRPETCGVMHDVDRAYKNLKGETDELPRL